MSTQMLKMTAKDSGPIHWNVAVDMIQQYQSSLFGLQTPDGKKLKGLLVDTEDILNILGLPNDPEDIDVKKIGLFFAIGETTNSAGNPVNHFTTVVGGLVPNAQDPTRYDIVTGSLVDYCEPCPDKCPENYPHLQEAQVE